MASWQTIWDHEVASYGRRSITFSSAEGAYVISVNDEDQDWIYVQYNGNALRWPVYVKEAQEGVFSAYQV